ncbi:small ubiquitin-related modifier 1 isoform X1 [Oryza glaberrima]|uniref:small ubiquitin-related modifier 1 isoform X1 n=1 Tax=Oryza glaberrima TaxID=4538 RepID=UPI00224BFFFD|nr:small ubiquitin-related modifier 1 isoform X1 [Oryza glaberrima]
MSHRVRPCTSTSTGSSSSPSSRQCHHSSSVIQRWAARASERACEMSAAGEEDKKPAGGEGGGAHINLKVKGQDGNEVFFRIKRSTQLKKLMNAYCDRQSVDMNAIAFLFDGRRLRGEQTPDELEMEDGDEIDAMLHQTGGCLPA